MAGPMFLRRKKSGAVRVRDTEGRSAPFHVSSDTKSKPEFEYTRPREISPERPRTSSGFVRKTVDKRQSRDDLYFNPLSAHQVGATNHNLPLLRTSTLTEIPRTLPLRDYPLGPSKPEYIKPDAQIEIGMAFGSPSHPPTRWQSHVQFGVPARYDSPESLEPVGVSSKQKSSKWKMFGGLFGRKPPTATFYQVQPNMVAISQLDCVAFPLPPSSMEWPRTNGRASSEKKLGNQKKVIKREDTVPLDFNFQEPSYNVKPDNPPEIRLDGGPLLNVDIPSTQMERYSVMFSSVLKPDTPMSPLLARRQATLDRLKTVNEAISKYERDEAEAKSNLLRPRRATSPQPTKSPAFSLFPVAQARSPQAPQITLHRSNTSPAALSPSQQTFEPPKPLHNETQNKSSLFPSPMLPAATLSSPRPPDSSYYMPDSPCDEVNAEEIHDVAPLKLHLQEPDWGIVGQAVAVPEPISIVSPPLHSRKESTTSIQTTDTQAPSHNPRKPSVIPPPSVDVQEQFHLPRKPLPISPQPADSQALADNEEMVISAAKVSIARQISVSRSQKQLLVPVKTRSENVATSANPNAAMNAERLCASEMKSMIPTLVNVVTRKVVTGERVAL